MWIKFEEIFKANPLTAVSYCEYSDQDYLKKYLDGLGLKNHPRQEVLEIYKNGNCFLCYKEKPLIDLSRQILRKLIKDPRWAEKTNQEVKLRSNRVFEIGQKTTKLDLPRLSNLELLRLLKKNFKTYRTMHVSGWFGNVADYKEIFTNYLFEYLERKRKQIKIDQPLSQILYTLTFSKKTSNLAKEEKEIIKIAKKICVLKKLKKLFKEESSAAISKNLSRISPQIDAEVKDIVRKYGWLYYQFEGPAKNKEFYLKKIKEVLEKDDPNELERRVYREKEEKLARKKSLFQQLKIDQKHKAIFKVYEDIIFLKGWRKDSMFFGCYVRDFILKEIAKRVKIPLVLLRYLYPWEIEKIFKKSFISKKELLQRFKFHLYFYQESKGSKIISGKQAQKFLEKIDWKKEKITKKDKIKGVCASPGKARGRAVIVNVVSDIKKIRQGDILISEATSPDLMPAIKKARAIITNVGGITCHAAIVSRELGLPCVIGTKIATQVLKDGDLIEVDANNGIVKILKK